jgi:hypothetical protein
MPVAELPAPPSAVAPLVTYLRRCGGRDILLFDTPADASAAAWRLRSDLDDGGVSIHSSYDKVFIELRTR